MVLDNPKGAWRPGLFVNVEVVSEETAAPVTISADAVQNVGEKPVVFLKVDGGFIAQPVKLGRSDGKLGRSPLGSQSRYALRLDRQLRREV